MSLAHTEDTALIARGRWRAAVQRVLHAVWVGVLPAVIAILAIRYLVPVTGTGLRGAIAVLGRKYALFFGLALYFVLSGVARYWRHSLPGAGSRWMLRPPGAESLAGPVLEWRRRREFVVTVAMIAAAAVAALVVRTFVARPYRVLSASMLPTLEPIDVIAGGALRHGSGPAEPPPRGEIIVFHSAAVEAGPGASALPDDLVKRVIGLPGDRVAMRGGVPIINGWAVPVCDVGDYIYPLPGVGERPLHGRLRVEFLDGHAYLSVLPSMMGPLFPDTYVVKPGEVFVLGDNRGNSSDSRSYGNGHGAGVPIRAIAARARWFLLGTNQDGSTDFRSLLRPVDRMAIRPHLESADSEDLNKAIANCLANRPKDTRPPAPF